MKSLKTAGIVLGIAIMMTACGPGAKNDDSADVANKVNDQNFDNRDQEKDADFVVNTIAANYAEIKLAQLAMDRTSNTKIKDIAKTIETDHSKVIDELKAFANKNGIAVPTDQTDAAAMDLNKMAKEDAEDFDNKWSSELKDKHDEAIRKFESYMDKTEDVELKNWISSTLPTLRSHRAMLEQVEG